MPRPSATDPLPLADVAVLVVDDDPASAKLEVLLLEQAGARVRSAASAEQAIAVLRSFQPRVIVLDLVLPRMSGLALVETLVETKMGAPIVFVAVTAINGPEGRRVALAGGCAEYVCKPIDTETFATIVARKLGES